MPCWTHTEQWTTNISNLRVQRNIQVFIFYDCCAKPRFEVTVDGQPLQNQQPLIHNGCSPLCGPHGSCEWQQDGHHFLLVENSTMRWCGRRVCLFIDGINVDTGLEYSAFFRRRGWCTFWVGLFFFLGGAVGVVCLIIFEYYQDGAIRPSATFLVLGALCLAFGLIAIRKFNKPLVYDAGYREPFSAFTT